MSEDAKKISYLTRKIEREKTARNEAEQLLEMKSLELYEANQKLVISNRDLEQVVAQRTQELVFANKELTQLIDTANAPIFSIDTKGIINEWNQQLEKITGFSRNLVIGRSFVEELVAPADKPLVDKVLKDALKGEETTNYEFVLLTRSGDHADLLLNSSTRRDATGKTVGVVGIAQDITELTMVRAEQDKERKEAAAQIIQASKLATLGEMATSVAHELNQPLSVIRMAAGNSRRKIARGTAGQKYLLDKLERIEEQTARAATIIDHMRIFGREAMEAPELIDPRRVITNALSLMGEQLRLDGIKVVIEFAQDCSSVLGHSIQMEQVILNLLSNARDALSERAGDLRVTLQVFADDKYVYIVSKDNGGGIAPDSLERIFEPFFTTKEMGKGTGLGLSVSYGIISDMKGTIVAENIDDGARLTIALPKYLIGHDDAKESSTREFKADSLID
ncbi:MAG: PAS domain S-box protein [Porticoccaceae bacterium]|nr:PAS domain S-box protein [Porticoccaceae bacterium]